MTATQLRGRTSPRSAIVATAVGVGALALAAVGVQRQVVAVDVVFQERPSQFAASGLSGRDMAFGTVPAEVSDGKGGTVTVPVLRGGFSKAEIDGLCVSQVQEILGVPYTVKITAGDGTVGTTDVASSAATFDLVSVTGGEQPGVGLDGLVQIGQTPSDVTTVPGLANPLQAPAGQRDLAISASGGNLTQVRGTVYGFSIDGADRIDGLAARIVPGTKGCDGDDLPR